MVDRTLGHPPLRLAFGLAALFGAVALLLAPPILVHLISLDWQLGDMRTPMWITAAGCLAIAIAIIAWRAAVARFWVGMFPTRRHLAFKLGMATFSFVFAIAVCELAFRGIDYPFHTSWTPSEVATGRFDDELGWSYKPDIRVMQAVGSDEREVAVRIDGMGARVADDTSTAPRLGQEPTVLFIGCSFTMGEGVTYEESFAGRVAAALAPRYSVVNLGVQGYGTDQSWLLLQRYAAAFNLKAVVYTFIPDHITRNDNHDRRLLHPDARFLGTKPRFRATSGGALEQIHRPTRYEDYSYSRLLATLQLSFANLGPGPSVPLTRALINAIDDTTASRGARFVAVNFDQGEPSSAPEDRVFEGLDGFPVVDLRTGAPPDWSSWVIPGDEHPSPRAHARAADEIVSALAELGIR